MKRLFPRFALLAASACLLPATGANAQQGAAAPAAVIIFLDRTAMLQKSAAGAAMYAQVEALTQRMEAELAPENRALAAGVETLQRDAAVMAPAERQQQIAALEQRRQAFQKNVQDRQAAIQAGLANARAVVERALGPILEAVMAERGANLLLDRGLVVLGATSLDVTQVVVDRLNVALPTVTVTVASP